MACVEWIGFHFHFLFICISLAATKGMSATTAASATATDPARLSLSREIGKKSSIFSIRPIVEKHPDPEALLLETNAKGKTPLLEAIEAQSPPDVIRYLIKRCPRAVPLRYDGGYDPLPLHRALRMPSKWYSPYTYNEGEPIEWTPEEHFDVIRLLVRQFPSSLSERTKEGWLPLHLALKMTNLRHRPLEAEIVEFLIRGYRRALCEGGEGGMLPLHCALHYGCGDAPLETVQMVVNAFPGALRVTDDLGRLPLHVAAKNARLPLLAYLVEKFPQAIRTKTHQDLLPLHILLNRVWGSDLCIIQFFVQQWPESVQAPDAKGNLPLHLAVRPCKHQVEQSRYLLEQFPMALRVQNDDGELPLHIAASAMRPEIIQLLLDACPESAQVRNPSGQLPVHIAALTEIPQAGPFFEHWPDSVYEQDSDGRLPLHALVGGRYTESFMENVRDHARLAPRTLLVADSKGRLPVHVAVTSGSLTTGASLTLVQVLVEACPESLRVRDLDGRLPFHSAVSADRQSDADVIKFLARRWLGALQEPDNCGNWPLHAALSSAQPPQIIRFLAAACPPSLQVRNNDGRLPLHLALAFLKKSLFDHFMMPWFQEKHQAWFGKVSERMLVILDDTPVGTIRWLVDQWPESLQEPDTEGRLPLHVAAALDPALIPVLPLVRLFVERWPDALTVADRGGPGFFPFQAAAIADAPLDVVYLLARLRPDRWISDAVGVLRGGEPQAPPPYRKRPRTES
jgi:ankyrin repeat protein